MELPNSRYHLLAACMMHVEGFFSTKSLAYKNNNPGNISDGHGHFVNYPTIQVGYDALVIDIIANYGSTLEKFLNKYAPSTENDTSMYITVVSKLSGINPADTI